MPRWKKLAITFITAHVALLAMYTFPQRLVPEQLRVIGQLYARPLFHQQWLLFAPDPPHCSCRIEARLGDRAWAALGRGTDTYTQRRVAQAIARHVQAEVQNSDTVPAPQLVRSMRAMAAYSEFEAGAGRKPPIIAFRLVEHCVTNTAHPDLREERITYLRTP